CVLYTDIEERDFNEFASFDDWYKFCEEENITPCAYDVRDVGDSQEQHITKLEAKIEQLQQENSDLALELEELEWGEDL
ncbi:MAG: hypothetical protein H8D23_41140, partial [Candidatus Brocadiales bacterium]|nr:hypothetical protein [Candidatus Brocadiales bacterium]